MKFHGLVVLALLGLSKGVWAQNDSAPPAQIFVPPSPVKPNSANAEPLSLPAAPNPPTSDATPDTTDNIEAELRKFRSELREFQTLREEVSRNTKAAEADTDRAMLQQRQELLDLLTKLAKNRVARKAAAAVAPAPQAPAEEVADPDLPEEPEPSVQQVEPSVTSNLDFSIDAADPFSLGKVLFRTGDFSGAEKAFRKSTVAPENEMTLKYLLATCLRRQSQWKPAMETYKAVAESDQDPVLRDLAKWQLDNIRWHQQSESQLEQMRKQRQKRPVPKNDPTANAGGSGQ